MIKMYGTSIHADLRQAIEENGLSSKYHLFNYNETNVVAALDNGTAKLPSVTPFACSKYIVNPKVSTYQTVGAEGEEKTNTFDFTSTMPVNLFVQITILANSISEIEEMEKLLTERYTQGHKLTVTGFDGQSDTFPFVMKTDSKKEIERSGGDFTIAGQPQKLYQSIIHLRCDRCVEVVKSYSPTQVQLDTDLQKQLVKRIVGLDATNDQFSKAIQNSTGLPNDAIEYAQKSIGAISAARESLVKVLNLPAACSNPQMVSKLYAMVDADNCNLRTAIEKLDKQEKAAASNRAVARNREDQIQALKKALDLTSQIASIKMHLSSLRAQKYDPKPTPPVLQQIPKPQYPEIKPTVPFWTAELLPALVFWPWILIYYFGGYQTKLKEETERIRNTPEYQQQCAAMDEAVRQQQNAADEQYRMKLKEYQEGVLPNYEKALAEWTKKRDAEIREQEAALSKAEQELAAHYEATKIVPIQYRKIEALRYIYDAMRSSNYTIAQAINSYEQAVQRQIEQERLEQERRRVEAEERAAWAAEEAAYAATRAERAARDSYSSNSSSNDGIFDRAKRRAEENRDRREARDAERQAKNAEYERKHQEARDSQRAWDAVHKANIERRRKGQPELPYPPRKWY